MNDLTDIARRSYQAYVDKDRAAIEAVIADNFHFTSPLDNRIDRRTYFERCWPNSETISDFRFIRLAEDGDEVFVTYEGTARSGRRFRNTEVLTVRDGKIVEAEVYFGWNVPHEAPAGGFLRTGEYGRALMSLRTIRTDGVELVTEAFGDPTNPPVLLIMGGMASMLWWPNEFCRRLAAGGRFVIRYDQRDSGLSTKYPPGRPGYGFDDAVDDVFRVLDGYRITAAHVAGFSLGGMVGQGAALKHPERVLSLTAISSTSPIGVDRSSPPESGKAWLEHMAVDVDWSDRAETVAYVVEDARLMAGTAHPFDEAETRAFVERDFDRSGGYLSATNHSILFEVGEAWQNRLHEMKVPLLVLHGTADPVFPPEHGAALARAVAGAKLLRLAGGGHEFHKADWDTIIGAIVEHTGVK